MSGFGVFGIVAVLTLALPAAGRAQQAAPGVTDTEVVLGTSTPLSGPAAAWGSVARGMEAWAAHVNDQGGLHGRKIRMVVKDDGYVPGRAVANVAEMKDSAFALVGLLGTAIINATKGTVVESRLPLIAPAGSARVWFGESRERLRGVFVTTPDVISEGEFLGAYAVKQLGLKRIAVFHQTDDYGKGGLEGVRRGVSASGGAQVVAEVPFEIGDRALGTHALKLKESGAQAVVLYATPTHSALILKEMANVGYRPAILASYGLGDPVMFTLAGDLWEGVHVSITGQVSPLTEPEAVRVLEIITRYEPRLKGREYGGLFGAVSMMLTVEGLKRAGRDLTRDKLVEALESVRDWKAEGIGAPITFGPARRHGLNAVRLMRAEKGKLMPLTGWQMFPPLY